MAFVMALGIRYAPGEVARRGKEIYVDRLRAELEPGNVGKYLAINVETGEWEMGEDHAASVLRAHAKHPDAGIYGMRIGYLGPRRWAAGFGGALIRPRRTEGDHDLRSSHGG